MSISVLIVDDHAIVRRGLKSMFEGSGVNIVGEASDGDDALAQTLSLKPDVVLLDIRMQRTDGLLALKKIREESPDTRVMILSTYDNPTYVARSVALGAKDYVLKGSSRDTLINRIRDVAADRPPNEDSILHTVKETMSQRKIKSDFPLTNRELQVLKHIALGLSNREIGSSLGISVETVKEHVQNILRKINAVDRTQAAVYAWQKGIARRE